MTTTQPAASPRLGTRTYRYSIVGGYVDTFGWHQRHDPPDVASRRRPEGRTHRPSVPRRRRRQGAPRRTQAGGRKRRLRRPSGREGVTMSEQPVPYGKDLMQQLDDVETASAQIDLLRWLGAEITAFVGGKPLSTGQLFILAYILGEMKKLLDGIVSSAAVTTMQKTGHPTYCENGIRFDLVRHPVTGKLYGLGRDASTVPEGCGCADPDGYTFGEVLGRGGWPGERADYRRRCAGAAAGIAG